MLRVIAPAKVNLYLYLSTKRLDGYHDLLSSVVFTELGDELTIEPSQLLTLRVQGEFAAQAGDLATNLVMKAARLLNKTMGTSHGAHITLTKHVPVGAGLGGGSADAAAALKALNHFWHLHLPFEQLLSLGLTLGADVPMCLHSRPLIAHGIGDVVAPIERTPQEAWMVLVHPRIVLLTKDVFAAISPEVYERAIFNHYPHVDSHLHEWWNDLQEAAIQLCPVIAEVITALATHALPTGQAVRMTGSGACCFALFLEEPGAQVCYEKMRQHHPEWWVQLTRVWL
jgi:4-diphosphocytidyl-2-C-methyl-D-erythritol kinase